MNLTGSSRQTRAALTKIKCAFCRAAKQKCVPANREWPGQKCVRCAEKGLACSEGSKVNRLRRRPLLSRLHQWHGSSLPILGSRHTLSSSTYELPLPTLLPTRGMDFDNHTNPAAEDLNINSHNSPTEAPEPDGTGKGKINVREGLLILSLQTVLIMALQELKLLATDMANIFRNDPHLTSPESWLPGLDEIFIEFKSFAGLLGNMTIDAGVGEMLSHAYNALQTDYNRPDISWSLEMHPTNTRDDIRTFRGMGYDEFAHVLLMKKLSEQAHITDVDAQEFIYCRERFLLAIGPFLEREDLRVPTRIQNSQMFIPRRLLQSSQIADHLRKVGLRDCLGRSVSHICSDAGCVVEWTDSDSNETDILGRSSLYFACITGYTSQVKKALTSKSGLTQTGLHGLAPLDVAASMGHLSACQYLWQSQTYSRRPLPLRDRLGRTPLMWAAFHGHKSVVEYFHRVARRHEELPDRYGCSAMTFAACGGHHHVVDQLLQLGFPADTLDHKHRSPFWYAACYGQCKVLSTLAKAGVEVDRKDIDGRTPLCEAAKQGHLAVLEYLLSLNKYNASTGRPVATLVDVAAIDSQGKSALVLSVESGRSACVKFLAGHNLGSVNALHTQNLMIERAYVANLEDLLMMNALSPN